MIVVMVKTQIYCLFRTKYNLSGRPNLVTDLEQRRDWDKMFFLLFDDVNENGYNGGDNNHDDHGERERETQPAETAVF